MKSSEVVPFGIRILSPCRPTRLQSSLFYIFSNLCFFSHFLPSFSFVCFENGKNLGWRDERMLKKEEMTSFSGNHFS